MKWPLYCIICILFLKNPKRASINDVRYSWNLLKTKVNMFLDEFRPAETMFGAIRLKYGLKKFQSFGPSGLTSQCPLTPPP